jgi:hypothetical protein
VRDSGPLRRLSIEGELRIELGPDRAVDVTASGDAVHVDVAPLGRVRPTPRMLITGARLLRRLSRELDARGFSLTIARGAVPLVRVGRGGNVSVLAAMVRFVRARLGGSARTEGASQRPGET